MSLPCFLPPTKHPLDSIDDMLDQIELRAAPTRANEVVELHHAVLKRDRHRVTMEQLNVTDLAQQTWYLDLMRCCSSGDHVGTQLGEGATLHNTPQPCRQQPTELQGAFVARLNVQRPLEGARARCCLDRGTTCTLDWPCTERHRAPQLLQLARPMVHHRPTARRRSCSRTLRRQSECHRRTPRS